MIRQKRMLDSFRRALGGDARIVQEVSDYISANWETLPREYQQRIMKETKTAIAYGKAGREHDQETWLLMLGKVWEKELRG